MDPATHPPATRTRKTRIVTWSLLIIGFLLTLSPVTGGAGILLLWVGFALGLKGRMALKVGGGFLGAAVVGAIGMAIGGTNPTAPPPHTATQAADVPRTTQRVADTASVASTSTSTTSNLPNTRVIAPTPPPVGSQWQYSLDSDAMSGGVAAFASVESRNTVEFSFPYQGAQRGRLTIRRHPRFGNDVIFRIERGQVLCPSYDGCTVLVRFDDKPPSNFSANPPADHSNETLFISNYSRFLARLGTAKTVRISPPIYQEGGVVFEFDVSGFDMKKFRGGGL